MAHLKEHVYLPANYSMGDAQPMRALLSTEIEGMRVRGTTDIVITESKNITGSDYSREHWSVSYTLNQTYDVYSLCPCCQSFILIFMK
jgi:hypothetical protein|mmetsp:Transcript_17203/g.31089  ORF Transcript_17203/g.31089 Transcript_17203/m.31089 type:complete len:88 (+) Transcript_17203:2352-2615(+)